MEVNDVVYAWEKRWVKEGRRGYKFYLEKSDAPVVQYSLAINEDNPVGLGTSVGYKFRHLNNR